MSSPEKISESIFKSIYKRRKHSKILSFFRINKQRFELSQLNYSDYDGRNLLQIDEIEMRRILSDGVQNEWDQARDKALNFRFPELSGGVNTGDQRAVYYLIKHFKPENVLEIGTHIGSSTTMIVLALEGKNSNLTTVDVRDVNDMKSKPWLKFGSNYSPFEIVHQLGLQEKVTFITKDSIEFMSDCNEKFDFIFLDGLHLAKTVYKEVRIALKLLNTNGVILLHDYFPDLKPLWRDNSCIPGPYLALEKIQIKNKKLKVLPLGELPWETKHNSRITSLALLTKAN